MAAGAGDMLDGAADRVGPGGWRAEDRVHSWPEADAQAAAAVQGELAAALQSCCLCRLTEEQTQGMQMDGWLEGDDVGMQGVEASAPAASRDTSIRSCLLRSEPGSGGISQWPRISAIARAHIHESLPGLSLHASDLDISRRASQSNKSPVVGSGQVWLPRLEGPEVQSSALDRAAHPHQGECQAAAEPPVAVEVQGLRRVRRVLQRWGPPQAPPPLRGGASSWGASWSGLGLGPWWAGGA